MPGAATCAAFTATVAARSTAQSKRRWGYSSLVTLHSDSASIVNLSLPVVNGITFGGYYGINISQLIILEKIKFSKKTPLERFCILQQLRYHNSNQKICEILVKLSLAAYVFLTVFRMHFSRRSSSCFVHLF